MDKKVYGLSGTDISSGYINNDYNPDWTGWKKCDLIDEMKKSDATVSAISDSLKAPLLATDWYIEAGGKSDKDREISDFIEKCLMYDMDFYGFLEEALLYIDYGFYLFEILYTVRNGKVVWKQFAPRIPKSVEKWSGSRVEWEDGHPTYITQTVNVTDEGKDKMITVQIPWEKLLRFTNRQTGYNFEGESIFRRCFSHWVIKQKLYKIGAVAAERYGVGTPYFKVKSGVPEDTMARYEEMGSEIRGNEKSTLVITDDVLEHGIMTMDGGASVAKMLDDMVRHHDKKMYDGVLAGFLNLTSGEGGSNALSADQSSFFILAVTYIAKRFIGVMNKEIERLVQVNYGEQEYYPTLCYTELNKKSMSDLVNSIATAVNSGLVQWGDLDEKKVRDTLGLAEVEDVQFDKEEKEEKEEPKEEEEGTDDMEEMEDIEEEKEDKKLAEVKRIPVPAYERAFTREITDYENYLASEYSNYDKMAKAMEDEYRVIMNEMIDQSDKERKDGVIVVKSNQKNVALAKRTQKRIEQATKKLEARWLNSPMERRLFNRTMTKARETLTRFSQTMEMATWFDEVKLEAMQRGYRSNIEAVLYNDPRRVMEAIDMLMTTNVEVNLAKKSIDDMVIFNRNTLNLSVTAHARGAFTSAIYDEAQKQGYTFFKILVPTNKVADLAPSGMTMGILYAVMTVTAINQYASKATEGKNAGAVQELGLHHGSYEYYMPVPSDDVPLMEELAKQQQQDALAKIEQAKK